MKKIQYRCPYCGINAGDIQGLKKHVTSQHGTDPLPVSHEVISLSINRQVYELKVDPEWTLYQVIHGELIPHVAEVYVDLISNRGNVEQITPLTGDHVIHQGDRSPLPHKSNGQIAPDKTQPPGN